MDRESYDKWLEEQADAGKGKAKGKGKSGAKASKSGYTKGWKGSKSKGWQGGRGKLEGLVGPTGLGGPQLHPPASGVCRPISLVS